MEQQISFLLENTANTKLNNVNIEKSPYINERYIQYFNVEKFRMPKDKLTMIDLFSGAGGFSVGGELAGFFSVFGNDYFEPALSTWKHNHPNSIACLGDIKNIKPEEVRDLLSKKGVNKINLITAGIPCQGFSLANRKRNSKDDRNFMFLELMKYVGVFEPDYVIVENVSGMQSSAGGKFVDEIKKSLENLSYTVSIELLNAADYGVPQTRKRLIFVGVKKESGLCDKYRFPDSTHNENNYVTVYDAISDLPELNANEKKTEYKSKPLTAYQKLMRGEANSNIIKPTKLFNHEAPNHPEATIKKIKNTVPGEPMYDKYKQRIRLSFEKPSPTQVAGGIRPQFQFGHPSQARGLSIRERARIQSFPDNYEFLGGLVQERVQTGNAVPPLLVFNLLKPIYKDIKRRDNDV